jgi:3-methyladenine DNA glycosylase AlkD
VSATQLTKAVSREIFEIADTLISDPDDLVQKGCGLMLISDGRCPSDWGL